MEHEQLREGDLLAYLEGAASPALAAHIAACARCRAELSGLRAADALLAAALMRASCPAPERLLGYVADTLTPGEAKAVVAHLAECDECSAELQLLRTPPAPSAFDRIAAAGAGIVRALRTPAAGPALALRGDAARRAAYAAGDYQLLLAVIPAAAPGGPAQIEGQLLGAEAALLDAPGQARLLRDSSLADAEIDDLGFFAFDDVAPGTYALTLALAGAEILVDELVVP